MNKMENDKKTHRLSYKLKEIFDTSRAQQVTRSDIRVPEGYSVGGSLIPNRWPQKDG